MRSILHRIVIASAVMMAAALATNFAAAESTTIKVPFSFSIAGQAFPAGDYSVYRHDSGNFVTLAQKGSAQSFSTVVGPGSPGPRERKVALNFDEVGETHVLQSIQYGAKITRQLNK
jgi:hypothetical protein